MRDSIRIVWTDDWKTNDISSTKLRSVFSAGGDISSIAHPGVQKYLVSRNIKFDPPGNPKPVPAATPRSKQPTIIKDGVNYSFGTGEEMNDFLATYYPTVDPSHSIRKRPIKMISWHELSPIDSTTPYSESVEGQPLGTGVTSKVYSS
jgi:hypothetical protein